MDKLIRFFQDIPFLLYNHIGAITIIVLLILLLIGFILGPASDPQPDWLYLD
jgi:hypothetical protein